ncbi:MAG: hypothetical protein AAGA48_08065 [Myxococcota bacterium]
MNHRTAAALARRAPFDGAARYLPFAETFVGHMPDEAHVVSLGDGIGSTVKWLRSQFEVAQRWTFTVVDSDHALLEMVPDGLASIEQRGPHQLADWAVAVDGVLVTDLAGVDSEGLALVSSWVARSRAPLLAGPVPDGSVRWHPRHPHDEQLQAAVRLHQRVTGAGPHAATWLADHLRIRGYDVRAVAAPWQVESRQRAMVRRLIEDTAAQASLIHGDRSMIEAWRHTRLLQARVDAVEVTVGQWDVVALPAERV